MADPGPSRLTVVSVTVPDGLAPGDAFDVTTTWGHTYAAVVPAAAAVGDTVSIEIPATEDADEQLLAAVFSQLSDADLMWKIYGFGREHAHMVSGRGRTGAADFDPVTEYSLATHEAHSKFCAMLEAVLEQHIATLGLSLDEFVAVVARRGGALEGTDGERLLKAVESLTNFDVFCDLMKSIDFQHTPAEPP